MNESENIYIEEIKRLKEMNLELQKENVELKKKNEELKQEYNSLDERYNCLEEEYKCLDETYNCLKKEYSENIIIESMNEMKKRYDTIVKTTVPSYKFTLLNNKYNKLVKNFTGCSVLIDYIIKLINKVENDIMNRKNILCKAELELITIKEILEDSINEKIN